MKNIWEARDIDEIDTDDVTDGHLMGLIGMFEKRDNPPPILHHLRKLAEERGIDLENKYAKENEDKKKAEQGDTPERLAVLYADEPEDMALTDRVITTGRTTINDLFTKSTALTDRKRSHHPFLVFKDDGGYMNIAVIFSADKLLDFSDETKIMVQWKGKFNSDFFHFTVKDLKDFLKNSNTTIEKLVHDKEQCEIMKKHKRRYKAEDGYLDMDMDML